MGFFLTIVCFILGVVFKYMKDISPAILAGLKDLGIAML